MLNALERAPRERSPARASVISEGFSVLLRMLSPITPHICHALWRTLGHGEDIVTAAWLQADEHALIEDEIELVVQVNGKRRASVDVARDATRAEIEGAAMAAVERFLEGNTPKKIIVVPGRLVNLVV